jgi:hypothetical protein
MEGAPMSARAGIAAMAVTLVLSGCMLGQRTKTIQKTDPQPSYSSGYGCPGPADWDDDEPSDWEPDFGRRDWDIVDAAGYDVWDVPEDRADPIPDSLPDAVPDVMEDQDADSVADAAPDNAPDAAVDALADAAPDNAPDAAADALADALSDVAPDAGGGLPTDGQLDVLPDTAVD